VQVVSDDNTHYAARIVAREFAGSAPRSAPAGVPRLRWLMGREIHALSIEALTPEESQRG
jgi:acid stress-induced BolA-like protein IbaG/YrbA